MTRPPFHTKTEDQDLWIFNQGGQQKAEMDEIKQWKSVSFGMKQMEGIKWRTVLTVLEFHKVKLTELSGYIRHFSRKG